MTMDTGTTVDRFRQISPEQFGYEVDRIWSAVSEIRATVVDQVQQQQIPPLTGLGILAGVTAQAFGYGLFHGEPAPADLVAGLMSSPQMAGGRV